MEAWIDLLADECLSPSTEDYYRGNQYDIFNTEPIVEPTPKPAVKKNTTATCRCCNKPGLNWKQVDGKWRLFEDSVIHKCKKVPLQE